MKEFQYAYRNKHSASTLLLGLTESNRDDLDSILVSLDLSNATKFIRSFLKGRSQYVNVREENSFIGFISSGIPQGSILGPILFVMYLEDCVNCLDIDIVKPFLYADDIQLLFRVEKTLQMFLRK